MQTELGLAPSLGEEAAPAMQGSVPSPFQTQIHNLPQTQTAQAKLDCISASVVIGMTAQFVSSIFGIVTEFLPRMLEVILLSIFIGMCVGVIAFALMSEKE